MDKVKETAERENGRIITVFNGDLNDGDHHDTPQIISRNEATQLKIAVEATKPLVELSDKVFVVRGTEVHVQPSQAAWKKPLPPTSRPRRTRTPTCLAGGI